MKIIIAGSRSFSDYDFLKEKCDRIIEAIDEDFKIEIVSGTAMGADRLGERYALENGFDIEKFPAQWTLYAGKPTHEIGVNKEGDLYWKLAGHKRNEDMAIYADAAIIFWDGKSRGTANMIYNANKHNLITSIYNYE